MLHLVFAGDSAYAGLEVRVRSMSVGEYYAYLSTNTGQQEILAEHLVSWNVEDDNGDPVPATLDGVLSREVDEIKAIKMAWTDNMVTIPDGDPLALSSTAGLSAMLDLPAEPLPVVELPAST